METQCNHCSSVFQFQFNLGLGRRKTPRCFIKDMG